MVASFKLAPNSMKHFLVAFILFVGSAFGASPTFDNVSVTGTLNAGVLKQSGTSLGTAAFFNTGTGATNVILGNNGLLTGAVQQSGILAIGSFASITGTIPSTNTPLATETARGTLEIATQAEAEAGTSATVAMTPLGNSQFWAKTYVSPSNPQFKDDFIGGSRTSNFVGELGWGYSGTVGSPAPQNSTAANPGVFRTPTGTTSGAAIAFFLGSDSSQQITTNLKNYTFDSFYVTKIGQTSAVTYQLGYSSRRDDWSGSISGMYFEFSSTASANWFAVCADEITPGDGRKTSTDTGIAANTSAFNTFRIYSTTAGTIKFAINGADVATTSTNVGTASFYPIFRTVTGTTSAAYQDVDYWSLRINVSR